MSKNFLDSNVYFGLSKITASMFRQKLTVFKNMIIILVEIVRMTLDAFWSEKSTICPRNISTLAPRVCAGGECSSDLAA